LKGRSEILSFLISNHENMLSSKDNSGKTPFLVAAIGGHVSSLKLILESHKKSIKDTDSKENNALHLACKHHHLKAATFIFETDEHLINVQNKHGDTPLHLAIQNEPTKVQEFNTDLVAFLIAQKADPSIKNEDGQNVMHICSKKQAKFQAKVILEPMDKELFDQMRQSTGQQWRHSFAHFVFVSMRGNNCVVC